MQISLLLMEEIVKLFAIMLMGYVVVKAGLMKSSESKSISGHPKITSQKGSVNYSV